MPDGLKIDRQGQLNGAISSYAEHVLICTGKDDWPSRIEEENGGDNLAADLRELFGRGGMYSDPYHNISVLNASFPSTVPPTHFPSSPRPRPLPPNLVTNSVYLLPSFLYVPLIPRVSFDAVHGLAKAYLLPEKLNAAHDNLSPLHRDRLLRATEESGVRAAYRAMLPGVEEVRGEVIVLVCGHRGRDGRCGVMGPVLREEFGSQLARAGVEVRKEPRPFNDGGDRGRSEPKLVSPEGYAGARADASLCVADRSVSARVGLISHIGGHKYAGNVIVYVPPDAVLRGSGAPHPLAGCGVWYGRVEPRHVEGIVAETVLGGRVIAELFRGAIGRDRSIVRL